MQPVCSGGTAVATAIFSRGQNPGGLWLRQRPNVDGGISVLLQPYFSAVPGNRAAGCCVFQNPFGGGRVSFVLFPVYPVSCLEGCGICILGAACGYAVQEQNGWHLHFLWRADVYLYPGTNGILDGTSAQVLMSRLYRQDGLWMWQPELAAPVQELAVFLLFPMVSAILANLAGWLRYRGYLR